MGIKDLFVDAATGQVSHTKIWANIAYAVGTWAFAWQVYKHGLTDTLLFAYLGCVAGSALGSKIVSYKYTETEARAENSNPA